MTESMSGGDILFFFGMIVCLAFMVGKGYQSNISGKKIKVLQNQLSEALKFKGMMSRCLYGEDSKEKLTQEYNELVNRILNDWDWNWSLYD